MRGHVTIEPRGEQPLPRAPLQPDAPEGQELLREELADPAYAEALPSWFDLLSQAVLDWFLGLFEGGVAGPPGLGLVITLLVIAALIAIAVAVYGLPARRRRARGDAADLFGATDRRTARQLRRDAAAAAGRGDWAAAIADRFRALARGLDERTIVSVTPGTTAHGFARIAAAAFSEHATQLERAADAFDDVRYLGRPGDEPGYRTVADLDDALSSAPSPVTARPSARVAPTGAAP